MNTRKKALTYSVIAIIALVIIGGTAAWSINTPKAHFTVDVNPSIQITTNQLNRVLSIEPLNEDARSLLTYYTKPQKNLEAVINDLLDLMVFTGYISGGDDNTVMITVNDDTIDKAILDRVNQAISDYLAIKQINANIVNQTLSIPETTNAQGAQVTGKEAVIEKIVLSDAVKTKTELMAMSLNELVAYANAQQIAPNELISVLMPNPAVTTSPPPSQTTVTNPTEAPQAGNNATLISMEKAIAIALTQVNGTIVKAELDIDDDDDDDDDGDDGDDTPEYEIKINKDGRLYEIEIDAITGRVLKVELDDDDDDDDSNTSQTVPGTTRPTVASTTVVPTTTAVQAVTTMLSAADARQAVLNRFGGIIEKIEYAYDDTNPHYKGEALKKDSKVVFELNARTQKFTKWDVDDDDSWDDFESALPKMITLNQAANLVISKSGQTNTFIQKIDFKWDDTKPLYEGEAFNKGVKYSFEIRAYGGEFQKWSTSNGDDTWNEKYYNVK